MKIIKSTKKSIRIRQNSLLQRIAFFFLITIAVTFILSINFVPGRTMLKIGDVAPRNITATETIEFTDKKATEKLKEETSRLTREVYSLNLVSIENAEKELFDFFSDINDLRSKYNISMEKQAEAYSNTEYLDDSGSIDIDFKKLIEKYSLNIENTTLLGIVELDQFSLEEIERNSRTSLKKIMQQGIKEDDIDLAKKQIVSEIDDLSTNQHTALIAGEIGEHFLRPSLFLDIETTQAKKQEAVSAVKDVKDVIRKDQIIIRKGEIVAEDHIEKLEALGLQNPIKRFRDIFGLFLVNTLLISLLSLYIFTYHRDIFDDINKIILLGVIYLTTILLAKIISQISGYIIPVAFASMLIAITLDSRLALWMTFLISINIGFIFLGEIDYMVVALSGGLLSIFSIRKATQRSSLTRAGLLIAASNVISITALSLIHRNPSDYIIQNSAWGILNGFISAVLTIGTLPFLETIFDISSSFRLMELTNPNQPLLKQLLVDAPGTYHHSVVVGNLAEAATEEIGGNSLLARVGAYYHDVGKLRRPYFFAENQEAYKNIHDDLEPSLSALVIASHVKEGVDMARKYKLPKSVIDIINQHHGTGLISYFYHRALQSNDDKSSEVSEDSYRYSGPKPQSKEAGVILLADMIEAEARTLNNPTVSRIKNLAQNVINRNLVNGQLDDCNLTLRELSKIKEVFSRILTGMFHNRVEYPDEELINKLKKERIKSESTNKKQTETNNKYNKLEKSIDDSDEIDKPKRNK